MSTLVIKILMSLLGAGMIAGAGFYIVGLIGDKAVLEATLEAERAAMVSFAGTVTDDINGYKEALGAVMDSYTENDNEKSRLENKLANHDLEYLAKKKPGLISKRITDATNSMFGAIEDASNHSTSPRPPKSP